MWPFSKKNKNINYAFARRQVRDRDEKKYPKPILRRRKSYVKHILNLKKSIVIGCDDSIKFYTKYLISNGFKKIETLEECDALIFEIETW